MRSFNNPLRIDWIQTEHAKPAGPAWLVGLIMIPSKKEHGLDIHHDHPQTARLVLPVRRHPIPDVKTPTNDAEFHALVQDLHPRLQRDETYARTHPQ